MWIHYWRSTATSLSGPALPVGPQLRVRGFERPCVVDTPIMSMGGYKQSGFGRVMGAESIEAYTQTKSVLMRLRFTIFFGYMETYK